MPKLSIIIPFYNVEPYIKRCLETVEQQTFTDFEVILVNDGTKDNCQDIVDTFVKRDKRFTCYQKENGGLSAARNYGMKKACGEYITFIDSDDYIDLDLYERMISKATETDADMVEADFIWEYDDKQVKDISKVTTIARLMIDIRVVAWNKLYRRSLIESLGVTFSVGLRYEDVDWCYKIIPYINKIESVHDTYIHYIQRSTSIANTQNEKVRDIYKILNHVISYYKEKDLYKKYESQLEYIFIRYIFGSSFLRTVCVPDKIVRKQILKEGYALLKTEKSSKNSYFKTINPVTYSVYATLFRMKQR